MNSYMKPTTIAQVQRTLQNTQRPMMMGSPNSAYSLYAKCRLDPFNTMGGAGIPDASSTRRIIVDHRAYCDVIFGAPGSCVLKTLPCVGIPLLIKSGSTAAGVQFTLNGIGYQMGANGQNYGTSWLPAMVFSEWATQTVTTSSGFPPPSVGDPFTSSRFRIVTQAFRIYYTGQANACSGIVTVTSDPVQVDESPSLRATDMTTVVYTAGVPAATLFPASNYMAVRISSQSNPTTVLGDTVQARPETGANILIKHSASEYDWYPMRDYGTMLESGSNPATSYIATVSGSVVGHIGGIDSGWESVTISISGATSGSSIRVECVTCVEYEPQPNSNVARFAKPQVATSPNVIAAIDAVAKTIPTSIPLASSMAPWLRTAFRAIQATAPIVGGMLGPYGAAGGGLVSAAAGMFA